MHVLAYIACSLDGFIAGPNGELEWLNQVPEIKEDYYDFEKLQRDIDCILMGRNTFEAVKSFGHWPYEKKVFVLSSSLKDVGKDYEGKVEIIKGNIREVLEGLGKRGNDTIYVDGGKVIQECISENMLDEIYITTIAKIIGKGIKLFDYTENRSVIEWELRYSKVLNEKMAMARYIRIRK